MSHWLLEQRAVSRSSSNSASERGTQRNKGKNAQTAAHRHGNEHSHHHHHHSQLVAVSVVTDVPLLSAALHQLLVRWQPALVRTKGFAVVVDPQRPLPTTVYVEIAGAQLAITPSGRTVDRTELVFIGDNIDEAELTRALLACQVGGATRLDRNGEG